MEMIEINSVIDESEGDQDDILVRHDPSPIQGYVYEARLQQDRINSDDSSSDNNETDEPEQDIEGRVGNTKWYVSNFMLCRCLLS